MRLNKDDFLKVVQEFVSVDSIPSSALRGQKKGTIGEAREFCASIDLSELSSLDEEEEFRAKLDEMTRALLKKMGLTDKGWGVARKGINLFLRNALYNHYLREEYNLSRVERCFESPIDGVVAGVLREKCEECELPRWPYLKNLSKEVHEEYQRCIRTIAKDSEDMLPVHVDAYLWTRMRKKS